MEKHVPKSPYDVCPLLPGMEVPEVTLPADDGSTFNLKDALRHRPAVIVFFRGGW
jgi:Peroxiredoxin